MPNSVECLPIEVTTQYSELGRIGVGTYGVVYAAQCIEDGGDVAIKKVTASDNPMLMTRLMREIALLTSINHDSVIRIHDIVTEGTGSGLKNIFLVTERMDTDLNKILYSGQMLTLDQIKYLMYQVCRALKYLHSAGILHRDLKPSNILVNKNCDLSLTDFGLSRSTDEEDMTEYVVTRNYRPPELLLSSRRYTSAVDMWSVGCILAEMFTKKLLFKGENYILLLHSITNVIGTPTNKELQGLKHGLHNGSYIGLKFILEIPRTRGCGLRSSLPDVPEDAIEFLEGLLKLSPADRFSAESALSHKYFDGLHDPEEEPSCSTVLTDVCQPDEKTPPAELREMLWQCVSECKSKIAASFEEECDTTLRTSLSSDSIATS